MKKRNIIIIAVIVLLGILAAVVAVRNTRKSTFPQDYHIKNTSTITKIFMADKENNQVTLTRQDSIWMVDGQYEASQPMIDLLLSTLEDMRIRQQVNKAATENVIKAIAAKSVKVEIYQNNYLINWFKGKVKLFRRERLAVTYYVGSETQDMLGSYMFREGDKVPYIVHIPGFRGFISPRFVTDPYAWRSHRIADLPVQRIGSVQLEIPAMPEESFIISREGEGFVMDLLQPRQRVQGFDTARVAQLLSSFVNLNFDEYAKVVPKVELDTTFSKDPRTILTITDVDGNSRQLKTYYKYSNPDDLKAMPDTSMYEVFDLNRLYAVLDSKDTVLIQYYIFDNILQPASFFMGQQKSYFAR